MRFFGPRESVLTATWTPSGGVRVSSSDLPDPWLSALERLSRDLHVRQYGGAIEHIEWEVEYDPDSGVGWLASAVEVEGRRGVGRGSSGFGAGLDDSEDAIVVSMADLVQNEVADEGTAWPWGESGGFMNAQLVDGVALWVGRSGETVRIGELAGVR